MYYVCKSCGEPVTPMGYRDPGGKMFTCTNLGSCRAARKRMLTAAEVESRLSETERAIVEKVLLEEPPSNDITCQFCKETEFDLIGLKAHLQRGQCSAFNEIEELF